MLLGSVSHDLLRTADRPVLVVPSGEIVERRGARRHRDEAAR
jgi:hypothetical protein